MEGSARLYGRPFPVIHINGFPGTGKLTVAGHLIDLFTDKQISAKLVHNHLLIDPADAILHRTQPGYQQLRHAIRACIFNALETESATFENVYIFTDFQSSDPVGSGVCAEYVAMTKTRGCRLVSIVLNCEEEENLRRLTSNNRHRTGKLIDGELVKRFRRDGAPVHRFKHDNISLELDIASCTAREVAEQIMLHCVRECPGLFSRKDNI